jgi:hypothetical protein
MPTIRELEDALARQDPDEMKREREERETSLSKLTAEAMAFSAEKETAPLVARDTLHAVLAEQRTTTRLARWTLVVAAMTLAVSVAGVVIALVSA